ncbi:hypothetical protein M9H77_27793 [Catharanthus roseus]|uniref:Uncharacterized protein n=1 Tax=Catharanthus roseus TaxID=4058 RepID=A0ACC0AFE2_CATRO|nr:hypothetical protein M9H77_27793 [Catharanthus roseus]
MEFVDSPECRSGIRILQNNNTKILNTWLFGETFSIVHQPKTQEASYSKGGATRHCEDRQMNKRILEIEGMRRREGRKEGEEEKESKKKRIAKVAMVEEGGGSVQRQEGEEKRRRKCWSSSQSSAIL